jgi:hypothetical protein
MESFQRWCNHVIELYTIADVRPVAVAARSSSRQSTAVMARRQVPLGFGLSPAGLAAGRAAHEAITLWLDSAQGLFSIQGLCFNFQL